MSSFTTVKKVSTPSYLSRGKIFVLLLTLHSNSMPVLRRPASGAGSDAGF